MSHQGQYYMLKPADARGGGSLLGSALRLTLLFGLLLFLALPAYLTWQWVDRNFLHWGVEDSKVARIETTELVEKLRSFEVVTVKYRYEATAETDVDKSLRAGPLVRAMPGVLAQEVHMRRTLLDSRCLGDILRTDRIRTEEIRNVDLHTLRLNLTPGSGSRSTGPSCAAYTRATDSRAGTSATCLATGTGTADAAHARTT